MKQLKKTIEGTLLPFASAKWYPILIGLLSSINTFILILSPPLTPLFLAGVLAKPEQRIFRAFCNAVGAAVGVGCLLYVGKNSELFPRVETNLNESNFNRTKAFIEDYSFVGVILYSILPIILHPMVYFAANVVPPLQLVVAVLIGRTIKYIIMGQLAITGSSYLIFFGASSSTDIRNKVKQG